MSGLDRGFVPWQVTEVVCVEKTDTVLPSLSREWKWVSWVPGYVLYDMTSNYHIVTKSNSKANDTEQARKIF